MHTKHQNNVKQVYSPHRKLMMASTLVTILIGCIIAFGDFVGDGSQLRMTERHDNNSSEQTALPQKEAPTESCSVSKTTSNSSHTSFGKAVGGDNKTFESAIQSLKGLIELKSIEPMRIVLKEKGEEACYTSDVYRIQRQDDSSMWVLKPSKSFQNPVGEVLAYKLSESLELGLVPETNLVWYKGQLGSIQRYVENTKHSRGYKSILEDDKRKDIQRLKLFWFMLGQWDVYPENVLVRDDNSLVAIDNANILNKQRVNQYGELPFVYVGRTKQKDEGSASAPIKLQGYGQRKHDVINKVKALMGDAAPKVRLQRWEKSKCQWAAFTYFVENGCVFSQHEEGDISYRLASCDKKVLAQFAKLNKPMIEGLLKEVYAEVESLTKNQGSFEKSMKALREAGEEFIKAVQQRKAMAFEALKSNSANNAKG